MNLLETRFWEPDAQLYADLIAAGDWNAIDPYRGQNANMHMCEAMLCALSRLPAKSRYLDRAHLLAQTHLRRPGRQGGRAGLGTLPDRLDARLGLQQGRSSEPVQALRLPARVTSPSGPSCC